MNESDKRDLVQRLEEENRRLSQQHTAPRVIPTQDGEARYRFSRLDEDNGLRHVYDVYHRNGTYLRRSFLDAGFLGEDGQLYKKEREE